MHHAHGIISLAINKELKMQQINKRIVMSAVALLLVCGVSLSGSAFAEHGSGDSSGSGSGSTTSTETENHTSTTTSSSTSSTENETETENHAHDLMEQFKQQGQAKVQAEIKDKANTRTAQQRQQSCEARKTALTKRMANAVTAAQRHKDTFDSIYTKVKAFHDSKNLNVANYDSLVAAVDSAQADAAAKIAALKSLDVTVDCTQVNSVTTNISAFREAVSSSRDSLKAYRKALVALVTALHGASTSTTNNSSTNNSTTQ
jgi:hypothetical protein